MKHWLSRGSLVAFAICTLAPSALSRGESITVNNPSFELIAPAMENPRQPGDYTTYPGPGNTIPDWTNATSAGVQYYVTPVNSSANYQYLTLDGVQGAYSDSALIEQTLSFTLQPGVYTLTVASGWRGGRDYAGGEIGLYAPDGTDLGSTDTVQPALQETFTDTTLTVDIAANNSHLGQDLVIEMTGHGQNGGTIDFDNVRLDYEPLPEPSTWALMGVGLMGLVVVARRRFVRV